MTDKLRHRAPGSTYDDPLHRGVLVLGVVLLPWIDPADEFAQALNDSRPCKVCGRELPSRRSKFCSDDCRKVSTKNNRGPRDEQYRRSKGIAPRVKGPLAGGKWRRLYRRYR